VHEASCREFSRISRRGVIHHALARTPVGVQRGSPPQADAGSLRVSLSSLCSIPQDRRSFSGGSQIRLRRSGGQRGLTAKLEQRASQATSLDSRFRENDTMKRCKDTSWRESEDAPHLHPLPSRERGLLASQGCAEGQSPFAGSLRVSLSSLLPLPPRSKIRLRRSGGQGVDSHHGRSSRETSGGHSPPHQLDSRSPSSRGQASRE